MLRDAEAPLLIAGPAYREVASDVAERRAPEPALIVAGRRSYERWLGAHEPRDPGRRGEAGDVILQMYTSGTTGRPQGRADDARQPRRHGADLAAMGVRRALREPHAAADVPHRRDRLGVSAGSGMARRPSWSASSMPRRSSTSLEHQRVTNAVLVPTMLQMLTAVPGAAERDYSALRSIAYGAAPITTPVLKASLRTFGCALFGLYGLDGDHRRRDRARARGPRSRRPARAPAALGRPAVPVGGAQDRRSGERGARCRRATVGEVWLRGPNVTPGYFNRPAETAAALTPDGWLRTGDGGYVDEDGYLFLTDRIKDMIVERRRERLSRRGGGGARSARRRRRRRGDRGARRALGRGGQGAGRPAARRAAGRRRT